MPRITIDGEVHEVATGRTILQALDDLGVLMNGVDVPHYCWHPKLSVDGSCRLCQVEVSRLVDGELRPEPKLQIACNTPVEDGMVVTTTSDSVRSAREGVMELLLVNHPLDCPICDQAGECKLQDYAFEYGLSHARTQEPRRALKKRVDLGPTITFDQERCILCRRCVRFCREVPQTGELVVQNRGDRSVIETFPGEPLENDYSMNVADICPVGALTTKDFRFQIRVWFLEDVPSLCTGCANGCNVNLSLSKNQVHRMTPRRNDSVNDTWICDEGRQSYKRIAAPDRLREVQLRAADGPLQPASLTAAIDAAADVLRATEPARIGVLASAHLTNEDLAVLRRLVDGLGATAVGLPVVLGRADALLMKAEKAPNGEGARALGFGDPAAVLGALSAGTIDTLIVLGHDVLDPAWGSPRFDAVGSLVWLDTHHSPLERHATVVFPTRHAAERSGSFTNHAGLVQSLMPAVEPAHEAYTEAEILEQIGRALALPGFGRAEGAA